MIIAIDGLAASGKGTLSTQLALYLNLPRLDTGLLYRAVGLACLDAKADMNDQITCANIARNTNVDDFTPKRLNSTLAARTASTVGALETVRKTLLQRQRNFASQPGGAVIDGRDIGTVVAPQANFKFWLHASLQIRAQRRWRQLNPDNRPDLENVRAQLEARDTADASRTHAPAKPAPDAILLDTSNMNHSTMLARSIEIIDPKNSIKKTLDATHLDRTNAGA